MRSLSDRQELSMPRTLGLFRTVVISRCFECVSCSQVFWSAAVALITVRSLICLPLVTAHDYSDILSWTCSLIGPTSGMAEDPILESTRSKSLESFTDYQSIDWKFTSQPQRLSWQSQCNKLKGIYTKHPILHCSIYLPTFRFWEQSPFLKTIFFVQSWGKLWERDMF